MSSIGDAIQEKCMTFGDRVIKLNDYLLDDRQHESLYADCEELVKILVHRCKKLNDNDKTNLDEPHLPSSI